MRAIVQEAYGSADVLQLRDIERPSVGARDVLVRVRAAGVDRGVWHLMTGLPYLIRIMGYGLRRPKHAVPGMDLAGTVEAVGQDVTGVAPGDEVFGTCDGSFAEYACARADKLAPKPGSLSFEQAAALPVSAVTALQHLRDAARLQPGQSLLILGASGGVGSFAVQIAKALGATVTGVCSTSKLELVRSLGAEHVLDYTREDPTDGSRQYDVILDIAGNRPLARLRRALTPRGTLVITGGEEGGRWFAGIGRNLRALLLSPFVGHTFRAPIAVTRQRDLLAVRDLVEAGTLRPVLDKVFPLSEAADAIRYLEAGLARGKLVISV